MGRRPTAPAPRVTAPAPFPQPTPSFAPSRALSPDGILRTPARSRPARLPRKRHGFAVDRPREHANVSGCARTRGGGAPILPADSTHQINPRAATERPVQMRHEHKFLVPERLLDAARRRIEPFVE